MSTKRSHPAQQGPPPDLNGFPIRKSLRTIWYREHEDRPDNPDRGCWWFSTHAPGDEPGGRFDLTAPHGTCYFGETPGVAVRERVGRFLAAHMPIPAGHITDRAVSTVSIKPPPRRVANLTSPDAAAFGVTGELAAGDNYPLTATWAQALHDHGHEALLYQPRFTPGEERALALFDTASTPDHHPHATRPVKHTVPVAHVLYNLGYQLDRSLIATTPAMAPEIDDTLDPEDA